MAPPKAAEKKPSTAGKAPVGGKAPAEKKEAGKKTSAASGEKKKRGKTRKETYSSYIYKGEFSDPVWMFCRCPFSTRRVSDFVILQSSSRSTPTLVSPPVPCPS